MQSVRSTGINAALISALFLGLAPVFGKAAMGEGNFSPLAVVALRTSLAAFLIVVLIAFSKRQTLYIYPAGFLGCMVAGAVNGTGSIFYYVGLSKLNASVAQMLYALYPFFVALWLQLDKQVPSKLTGFRILIAGISAFLLTKANAGHIDPWGVVYPCITYSRPMGRLRDTNMRLDPIWNGADVARVQGEIWKGQCPQCWTACEAYQSIIGNALVLRRATDSGTTKKEPAMTGLAG